MTRSDECVFYNIDVHLEIHFIPRRASQTQYHISRKTQKSQNIRDVKTKFWQRKGFWKQIYQHVQVLYFTIKRKNENILNKDNEAYLY